MKKNLRKLHRFLWSHNRTKILNLINCTAEKGDEQSKYRVPCTGTNAYNRRKTRIEYFTEVLDRVVSQTLKITFSQVLSTRNYHAKTMYSWDRI